MSFEEVDRRYAELKHAHDIGALSIEDFDARLKEMMIRDTEDRWWAKSRETGEWFYHDGEAWVQGTPPGYGRSRPSNQQSGDGARPNHEAGAAVQVPRVSAADTSGMGSAAIVPPEIKRWNWGAFLWSFIWAAGNRLWGWALLGLLLSLLALGIVPAIVLGINGNEWAWRARRWNSVEHFQTAQRRWAWAGLICVVGIPLGLIFLLLVSQLL